jgi:hypothetical protein
MPDKKKSANTNTKQPAENSQESGANEGEGSQTGARQYNEATREFIAGGKVKPAADDAARALDGREARTLRQAEAEGKRHSHGEDPKLYETEKSR